MLNFYFGNLETIDIKGVCVNGNAEAPTQNLAGAIPCQFDSDPRHIFFFTKSNLLLLYKKARVVITRAFQLLNVCDKFYKKPYK